MVEYKSMKNKRYMTTCGKEIWDNRSAAVCVHVYSWRGGEVYVAALKRGEGMDQGGLWCMSCGYLDWDETLEEGARREVREELGLELGGMALLRIDDSPAAHKQNITVTYRSWVDDLLELNSDGAEDGEVQELRWIKVTELGDYEWAFGHAEMIQRDMAGDFR